MCMPKHLAWAERWLKIVSFCPARLLDWDIKSEILHIQVENLPSDLFSAGQNMANQCPFEEKTAGFNCDKTTYRKHCRNLIGPFWQTECFFPLFSCWTYARWFFSRIKHVWYLWSHICLPSTEVPQKPVRKSRPATRCCLLLQLRTWCTVFRARIFSQILFSPFLFITAKKKKRRKLMMLIILYLFFYWRHVQLCEHLWDLLSVELPLWNRYYKQESGLMFWMNRLQCAKDMLKVS